MRHRSEHGWTVFSLIGIVLWIGATVAVTVINDDPGDGKPVLLTFAAGGAIFFGLMFGAALWQTRPRSSPELDAMLAELTVEPLLGGYGASHLGAMRRVARVYLLLGALVTALGLAAIVQAGLGVGSPRTTFIAMVVIVVLWALAVPWVLSRAQRASSAVLTPLGLEQSGGVIAGERHGRRVRIDLTGKGWKTRLSDIARVPELSGAEEILARAGRGGVENWRGVTVEADGDDLIVRREGHDGAAWLWDLWLAESIAGS